MTFRWRWEKKKTKRNQSCFSYVNLRILSIMKSIVDAERKMKFAHIRVSEYFIAKLFHNAKRYFACSQGKFHWKKATKKIFFAVCNKDSNPSNVNEIVRCTMKSSLSSDEIFSLRLQMKSNPPIFCRKADFIAKRFHPPQVDLFRRRRI